MPVTVTVTVTVVVITIIMIPTNNFLGCKKKSSKKVEKKVGLKKKGINYLLLIVNCQQLLFINIIY